MLEAVWELPSNTQTNAAIKELLIYFFMVITRLRDGAVLFAIAIFLYWYEPRDLEKKEPCFWLYQPRLQLKPPVASFRPLDHS